MSELIKKALDANKAGLQDELTNLKEKYEKTLRELEDMQEQKKKMDFISEIKDKPEETIRELIKLNALDKWKTGVAKEYLEQIEKIQDKDFKVKSLVIAQEANRWALWAVIMSFLAMVIGWINSLK